MNFLRLLYFLLLLLLSRSLAETSIQTVQVVLVSLFLHSLLSDILWPVLRGGESLQNAAHLLREDHRNVQRKETT